MISSKRQLPVMALVATAIASAHAAPPPYPPTSNNDSPSSDDLDASDKGKEIINDLADEWSSDGDNDTMGSSSSADTSLPLDDQQDANEVLLDAEASLDNDDSLLETSGNSEDEDGLLAVEEDEQPTVDGDDSSLADLDPETQALEEAAADDGAPVMSDQETVHTVLDDEPDLLVDSQDSGAQQDMDISEDGLELDSMQEEDLGTALNDDEIPASNDSDTYTLDDALEPDATFDMSEETFDAAAEQEAEEKEQQQQLETEDSGTAWMDDGKDVDQELASSTSDAEPMDAPPVIDNSGSVPDIFGDDEVVPTPGNSHTDNTESALPTLDDTHDESITTVKDTDVFQQVDHTTTDINKAIDDALDEAQRIDSTTPPPAPVFAPEAPAFNNAKGTDFPSADQQTLGDVESGNNSSALNLLLVLCFLIFLVLKAPKIKRWIYGRAVNNSLPYHAVGKRGQD